METLFELPTPAPPPPQPSPTATCRTCKYRERWQCGGSIIQYCGKQRSNRTDNGLKKIKVTNPACGLYREHKYKEDDGLEHD